MASISKEPNGRRTIQFVGGDGKRRSLRLGKVPQKTAEAVRVRVEALVATKITGHAVDDETSRWIAALEPVLAAKLAAVGLIPERDVTTLGAFLDAYLKMRSDVKPMTRHHLQQAADDLISFLGRNRPLRDISEGDADAWRLFLLHDRKLGENTCRRVIGRAKQFLHAAVKRRLVPANPFTQLKSSSRTSWERFRYVTRDEAQKVLDACPDAQWRLLFVLSRFGGLRCPSEHFTLKWGDVDWENNSILVTSPKTAHHLGKESRTIPLFPELRQPLEEVWEQAVPGTVYVITRYRDRDTNLRTQLKRIIIKAGLVPWEKPFQNLRSTRETELAETFPLHVVCKWIGNSEAVAKKHYLQTTDEHFKRALEVGAVRNPVQQPAASRCRDLQTEPVSSEATCVLPGNAIHREEIAVYQFPTHDSNMD